MSKSTSRPTARASVLRALRRFGWVGAVAMILARPAPASAQRVESLIGAAFGAAGGGFLTIAAVTAESRLGTYLFSPGEVGWQLSFLPGLGLTGAVLGYQDPDRMWSTVIWGSGGFLLGVGTGALLGRTFWEAPEGKWAGGIIGGGLGLIAGSLVGAMTSGNGDGPGAPGDPLVSISVPVSW